MRKEKRKRKRRLPQNQKQRKEKGKGLKAIYSTNKTPKGKGIRQDWLLDNKAVHSENHRSFLPLQGGCISRVTVQETGNSGNAETDAPSSAPS